MEGDAIAQVVQVKVCDVYYGAQCLVSLHDLIGFLSEAMHTLARCVILFQISLVLQQLRNFEHLWLRCCVQIGHCFSR